MLFLYMGKEGIKHYPLNRYVVQRDGNGNVIEIVTKELIDRTASQRDETNPLNLMLLVMMV